MKYLKTKWEQKYVKETSYVNGESTKRNNKEL
jgi:hypothetical protein